MELAPSGGGNLDMANRTSESSQSKEVIQLEGGGERRVEQSSSVESEQRVQQTVSSKVSIVQNGQERNGELPAQSKQEIENHIELVPTTEAHVPQEEKLQQASETSNNPLLLQPLSQEELQSFPPAEARPWEPPPPPAYTSQLQPQPKIWEAASHQSSPAQHTLQQSIWKPSQQAPALQASPEPAWQQAPVAQATPQPTWQPSQQEPVLQASQEQTWQQASALQATPEPACQQAPAAQTTPQQTWQPSQQAPALQANWQQAPALQANPEAAEPPIWSAVTQTSQWPNQLKPWQNQPARPQSWHVQDQPTEAEPQWKPVKSPGGLSAQAEPVRASSEPKQADPAELKQWQQFPQKQWRDEWQEQQVKQKRPEPIINDAPPKKGSDLPQENIRTSLNEIISDIEKAVDLTADLSLGDLQVDSSTREIRPGETKVNQVLAESSTNTTERLQHKLDRQTSTTSLERALISQHSQIARELNQVLGNNKTGELEEKTEEHAQQDENRHPWNPDGLHHKAIDLEKLFTPASDSGEVTPSRSRRMFASSSFYAPNHPTVEEQVELARRISASLSDISNQRSKGQTMYVHRKKRSVKWVHEAPLEDGSRASAPATPAIDDKGGADKPMLKLIMDPRGAVQDLSSLRRQGVNVEPALSPEVCFDLVRDLNAPKGKGAELFAKRRKKSEKWVVDETTVKTTSTTTTTGSSSSSMPQPVASYLSDGAAKAQSISKMNEIQVAPTWTATATACTTTTRLAGAAPGGAPGLYQPRTPRGWGSPSDTTPTFGVSGNGVSPFRATEEPAPLLLREAACSVTSGPTTNGAPAVPPRSVFLDYSNFHNYNTAPRGWGPTMDYYRPVTFSKAIAASDF